MSKLNYKIGEKEKDIYYQNLPKKYIQPYLDLAEEAKEKLGLKTEVEVKLGKWWRSDPQPNKNIINCPPFQETFIPTFLHYMCHFKIGDEGWPRPAVEHTFTDKLFEVNSLDKEKWENISEKEQKSITFNFINRAADSFFDFFVWRLVPKVYGKKYLLSMIGDVDKNSVQTVIDKFTYIYKDSGFKYFNYIFALDYFAMFYVITETVDPHKHEDLKGLYEQLRKNKEFQDLLVPNFDEKVRSLQKFYKNLHEKYPTYQDFLADKETAKRLYREYYAIVWEGTGLEAEIVYFV